MSTPQDPDPKPAAPAAPDVNAAPSADGRQAEAQATKSVKGSDLVSDDHDTFPPRRDGTAPGGSNGGDPEAGDPAPGRPQDAFSTTRREEFREYGRRGGRPSGKKDSKSRGRPARADWGDQPMHPKKGRSDSPEFEVVDDEPEGPPVDYRALATLLVDATTGGLQKFLGEIWKPMAPPGPGLPDEREMLIGSLAKYFEANKVKDIPPGWMLVLTAGMYALPRAAITFQQWRAGKARNEAAAAAARPQGPERQAQRPQPAVQPNGAQRAAESPEIRQEEQAAGRKGDGAQMAAHLAEEEQGQ